MAKRSMASGWKVDSPGAMIAVVIGVLLAVELIKTGFPLLMTGFASLSTLGNFTFASFFGSAGLMALIISAVVLIGILSIIGVKTSRR